MRHRIKKIPTLSKLSHIHNHLLHSDKSTYTALRFGHFSRRKVPNDKRPVLFSPEKRGFLEKMKSYVWSVRLAQSSHNTYFYNNGKIGSKLSFLYSSKISTIPLVLSAFGLLLVLGCMISPNASISGVDKASAISEEECRGNTRVAMSLSGVTGDTVSLVNNNVNSDITNNTLSKLSQDFNVIACNVKNYKLYVQAESSLLKNQFVPDALLPVGNNVDESAFPDNTWGYNISPIEAPTNTYSTMPDLNTTIPEAYVASKGTSYQGQDFTISFAAKFTDTKAAGHYTSDVLLSLVADPNITLSGIDTMQEMTPVICANSTEHETKQLIDVRDHKSYWVAKLKDGNCWMTQNLDLDLNIKDDTNNINTTRLAPDTSDVLETWHVPTDLKSELWDISADINIIKYFDPGMYVFTDINTPQLCVAENGNFDTEDCKNKGWVNVKNMTASNDPNFGDEVINNTYNAHRLEGNLYSWGAATAGQSALITDGTITNTTTSICPSGWTLPTSGRNSENRPLNNERSYAYLLESYGWQWNIESTTSWEGYISESLTNTTGHYIYSSPTYFIPSGIVTQSNYLTSLGHGSWLTSSTASGSNGIFYLLIDTGEAIVAPSSTSGRTEGESIRCVAR